MTVSTRELVDGLTRAYPFPDPRAALPHGLLAQGGDLGPERLLAAYAHGIFPWYDEPPILWFSPDPRMVLCPSDLHVGRSLARRERRQPFRLSMDTAFEAVIRACAETPRPGQAGTWINADMIDAYVRLHELGFAHSVEAWAPAGCTDDRERLVGGLYGVSLGRAFFGESMFAREADASKIAFAAFVRQLRRWRFEFIDCQVRTEHLARFGAIEWSRDDFLDALAGALRSATRRGAWDFDQGAIRSAGSQSKPSARSSS